MKESSKILLYGLLASILLILLCLYNHQDEFMDRDKVVEVAPLQTVEKEHDYQKDVVHEVIEKVEPLPAVPVNKPILPKKSMEMNESNVTVEASKADKDGNSTVINRTEFRDKEHLLLKERPMIKKEEKNPDIADKNLPIEDNKPLIDNEKRKEKKSEKEKHHKKESKKIPPVAKKVTKKAKVTIASVQKRVSSIANRNISFYKSKAQITSKGKATLNKIIPLLKTVPNAKIMVKGYTDASGKEAINLWISQERAKSVKRYLGKHGIPSKNIVAKGYGERELLYGDKPYSKLNRRVEIEIKKGK